MKNLILSLLALIISGQLAAQELLFECGQNSGNNFNGWYFPNYHAFDELEFGEYDVAFFSEFGGDFDMTLTREIEGLSDFELLHLLFNFEVINNAELIHVTYYTSTDGKNWKSIPSSKNNVVSIIDNQDLQVKFIRATATGRFHQNGKIACNYIKVEGEQPVENLDYLAIADPLPEPAFLIFNYLHTLNIETSLETNYDVLITSVNGKIVYRSTYNGSNRIELPAELSGFFIVTIIDENMFKASKRIVL